MKRPDGEGPGHEDGPNENGPNENGAVSVIDKLIHKVEPHFEEGGKFHRLYYVFDMLKSMNFSLPTRTQGGVHIRDGIDVRRMMATVIIALIPALLYGIYNVGYQTLLEPGATSGAVPVGQAFWVGLLKMLPILAVTYVVGGVWETVFAVVRKHEVSEGFLVTGLLVPLIVPPTIPLWQLAIATSFGVVIGKEIFGGTGMNIFNPALVIRAFLFFAYPVQISGDLVWVADGRTAATPLAVIAEGALETGDVVTELTAAGFTWWNMFVGSIPGSIGETSALAILLGGVLLAAAGVGSWRVMLSMLLGGIAMALLLNLVAPSPASFAALPAHYHLVMGGFAFGLVYMATDPVSAAATNTGKWIYGAIVGALSILVRTVNPAYPEGVMLAILFMNMFAPLIDHYVVKANMRRRLARAAQ
jgi:Na+-transporting NADH:ubiquinone oxidoreductase subunit B